MVESERLRDRKRYEDDERSYCGGWTASPRRKPRASGRLPLALGLRRGLRGHLPPELKSQGDSLRQKSVLWNVNAGRSPVPVGGGS